MGYLAAIDATALLINDESPNGSLWYLFNLALGERWQTLIINHGKESD